MRILYVQATLVPPPVDPNMDRFFRLSEKLDGDVLQPVWFSRPDEVEAIYGPGSYPVYEVGRFRYHWCLSYRYRGALMQRLGTFWFYIRKGVEVCRQRHPDCIVAYSHMATGLMAGVVKLLTGTRLIIEIMTSPKEVYLTDRPRPTLADRLMHFYSDISLHLSMLLANRAHFLFPGQLSAYPLLRNVPNSVFHDFTLFSVIQRAEAKDETKTNPFVLFVGAPWYLKGVDLLIAAFRRLAPDFPDVQLKLMGFFPDRTPLEKLAAGCDQIEIMKHRPHPETVKFIGQASILVLPSRCEGMGRVLIEGMASAVPLIGSDVGGIPYMIRDGENGLVFPSGDVKALEDRLRRLLSDPDERRRMGQRGYERGCREFTEQAWVDRFIEMLEATVTDRAAGQLS